MLIVSDASWAGVVRLPLHLYPASSEALKGLKVSVALPGEASPTFPLDVSIH